MSRGVTSSYRSTVASHFRQDVSSLDREISTPKLPPRFEPRFNTDYLMDVVLVDLTHKFYV